MYWWDTKGPGAAGKGRPKNATDLPHFPKAGRDGINVARRARLECMVWARLVEPALSIETLGGATLVWKVWPFQISRVSTVSKPAIFRWSAASYTSADHSPPGRRATDNRPGRSRARSLGGLRSQSRQWGAAYVRPNGDRYADFPARRCRAFPPRARQPRAMKPSAVTAEMHEDAIVEALARLLVAEHQRRHQAQKNERPARLELASGRDAHDGARERRADGSVFTVSEYQFQPGENRTGAGATASASDAGCRV